MSDFFKKRNKQSNSLSLMTIILWVVIAIVLIQVIIVKMSKDKDSEKDFASAKQIFKSIEHIQDKRQLAFRCGQLSFYAKEVCKPPVYTVEAYCWNVIRKKAKNEEEEKELMIQIKEGQMQGILEIGLIQGHCEELQQGRLSL